MKSRILLMAFFVFIAGYCYSADVFVKPNGDVVYGGINYSSFTATNETGAEISGAYSLAYINVSSATPGGLLSIYDSKKSTSAVYQIGKIDLSTVHSYIYDIRLSSGLTYTTSSNSNGVSIIYKK